MSTNFKYQRGSEWRKWDMHLHAPGTKLNNQYSISAGSDVMEEFCKFIENSDVDVFGITDYFSIDNYFRFIEKFKIKYPNSNKVFFPNIEYRIDSKNKDGDHIQFHVIFSNHENVLSKIDNFLTRLPLVSTDDQNTTNKYCTQIDLNSITYEKAMVKLDDLEEQLKCTFSQDEYILVGVARGYGSIRPGNGDGRGNEYAKEIDKKVKAFFGSSKDTDFYLNVIEGRSQYNLSPKSVLACSDAHSFEHLNTKLGKTFEKTNEVGKVLDYSETTWIKADPTFEGLRQIMYEPKERIKIQELKPEDKQGYQIIERINFIDNSFTPTDIYLNQNLTTIIGGKSTGKSILLRSIAETIDPNEVKQRIEDIQYDQYINKIIGGFNVIWKDGKEDKKGIPSDQQRKIIYIPQSYLNRLVDNKEDKNSIDEIIKNVLEQEEEIKKVYADLEVNIRDVEKQITLNIDDLFYKERDLKESIDSIKRIGDKKGIENEIIKLKDEISDLKEKSGMSQEDINKYNDLVGKIFELKQKGDFISKDLEILKDLKAEKLTIHYGIFPNFSTEFLSENIAKEITETLNDLTTKINQEWIIKISEQLDKVDKIIQLNQTELNKLNIDFTPLHEQVIKFKSIQEKIKKLEEEEKRLKIILEEESKYVKLKNNYFGVIKNIVELHAKFSDYLYSARTKILDQKSIHGELEFDIEIIPKNVTFNEEFIKLVCNLTNLKGFEDGLLDDYKISNQADFSGDIKKILEGILKSDLKLKNGYTRKEAITKLLKNWFTFDYKIMQDGDEISDMSPGKKSFVLLKLLIELDNSKCPILLDQPEDDLDNRSIYNDLVKFICKKKTERQIIIATHNPNLVVGSDAECVIVSNQKGKDAQHFKFDYVQGSLENTFLIDGENRVLYRQGIQEHVCDVLEGGKIAFEQRKNKYNISF